MTTLTAESNLEWRSHPDIEGVMIGDARKDGPTVVTMGAVHGDEYAGIEIVREMPHQLSVESGRVIAVLGNLRAARMGMRQTPNGVNLNRSFRPLHPSERLRSDLSYERLRGWELMDLVEAEQPIAMLDIHEYEDPAGKPFIIGERPSLAIARCIGAPVVAFGFAEAEPGGSDGYGHSRGIPALCYEIGPMGRQFTPDNVRFGKRVVSRFLAACALTSEAGAPLYNDPLLVEVDSDSPVIRTGETFKLARRFKSFERLTRGELLAIDGGTPIYAATDQDQVMIFPKPTVPDIDREAFELGRVVTA